MESMIAMMAVITVLSCFLGIVVNVSFENTDRFDDLDIDKITGEIVEGRFIPSFEGYLGTYIDTHGLSGIEVTVSVPGGFCETSITSIGIMDEVADKRLFTSLIGDDEGRSVYALFEVRMCV